MSRWQASFLTATTVFSLILAFCDASETISDPLSGKSFPRSISFKEADKEYKLNATGTATRKKFFVKVYSAAHYIEDGQIDAGDVYTYILNAKKAKQLTQIWLRAVDTKQLHDGYREAFSKANSPRDLEQISSDFETFLAFYKQSTKVGETHILRWTPDGVLSVEFNGAVQGTIKSETFARALWSIWFGQQSVVPRKDLVKLLQ